MSDCEQVLGLLAEGHPLPAPLTAHAHDCPRCHWLVAIDTRLAPPGHARLTPGPALRAAIEEDHAPVRLRSPLRRALLPAAAVFGIIAGTAALMPRANVASPAVVLDTLALMVLAAGALAMVFYRGAEGLGPPARLRWGYALAAVLAFQLLAVARPSRALHAALGPHAASALLGPLPDNDRFQGSAVDLLHGDDHPSPDPLGDLGECASYGFVLAALVGAMVLRSARHTTPVAPGATGACAGVAAGLAAAAALELHCPCGTAHVALVHGLPVVMGAGLGALVGRRALPP